MWHDYPYTDAHELNLDWFLARFKELVEEWNSVKEDWNSLHEYVQNYFDNLNVQNEINNKLDALVADGTLATIMEPYINLVLPSVVDGKLPAVVAAQIGTVVAAQISAVVANQLPAVAAVEVADWLSNHVDPDTGYVIDDSMSISGAAADAAAVGDIFKYIIGAKNLFSGVTYTEGYYIDNNGTISSNDSSHYTSFIPVDSGNYCLYYKDSTASGNVRVHGYDANGDWVSMLAIMQTNTNNVIYFTFSVPSTVTQIRVSSLKSKKMLALSKGSKINDNVKILTDYLEKYLKVINPYVNKFNKDDPDIIHAGYFRSKTTHALVSNASFTEIYLPVLPDTQYICTGTSYNTSFYGSEGNFISATTDDNGTAGLSFTTPINCFYVSLNVKHAIYPLSAYMVVTGSSLPGTYMPYGKSVLVGDLYTQDGANINNIANEAAEIYYVGSDKEYTSFTDCIRALQGNTNKKIIYVDGGTYDIYNEIGGDAYANTVGNEIWTAYNDIIPPNTKIIGVGNVIFDFDITSENSNAITKLSPINVKWSAELENITINANNCRYAIHDDGSSDVTCRYTKHVYRNVTAIKTGGGYAQAFGSGIGKGTIFEFDGCVFKGSVPFSIHSASGSYDGMITFKNCVFKADDPSANYAVRLSGMSSYTGDQHIDTNMFNCYLNNKVILRREDPAILTELNPFKLLMSQCSNVTVDTSGYTAEDLRYTPEVLQ